MTTLTSSSPDLVPTPMARGRCSPAWTAPSPDRPVMTALIIISFGVA